MTKNVGDTIALGEAKSGNCCNKQEMERGGNLRNAVTTLLGLEALDLGNSLSQVHL